MEIENITVKGLNCCEPNKFDVTYEKYSVELTVDTGTLFNVIKVLLLSDNSTLKVIGTELFNQIEDNNNDFTPHRAP